MVFRPAFRPVFGRAFERRNSASGVKAPLLVESDGALLALLVNDDGLVPLLVTAPKNTLKEY